MILSQGNTGLRVLDHLAWALVCLTVCVISPAIRYNYRKASWTLFSRDDVPGNFFSSSTPEIFLRSSP